MFEQPVTASPAEFLHRQSAPAVEGLAGPDEVHAANEATDPLERGWAFQLRRPSRLAVGDPKAECRAICADLGQRGWGTQQDGLQPGVEVDLQRERRRDGDFFGHQLAGKRVLFENLCVGPATGPVKLGHHRPAVFKKQLEDAVLERIQLQQPAVCVQPRAVHRVKHHSRSQPFIGGLLMGWLIRRELIHVPIVSAPGGAADLRLVSGADSGAWFFESTGSAALTMPLCVKNES